MKKMSKIISIFLLILLLLPVPAQAAMKYQSNTGSITIHKKWVGKKKGAYCYIAHLKFSKYSRLKTGCANGKYKKGMETTKHAFKRLKPVFMVNGDYSAPYLNYGVVRNKKVWNNKPCYVPAVYSQKTGVFSSPEALGITGIPLRKIKKDVTDTFCFGPAFLIDGKVVKCKDKSRAQRTFIGSKGKGNLYIVVTEGRKSDGKSDGLTYQECASLLKKKGCTFGIPLDGGGSSTMIFKGKILNHSQNRKIVDFLYFK